ncbi:hypothetical protein LCGC14_2948970, partial [marine sediment metagenome]
MAKVLAISLIILLSVGIFGCSDGKPITPADMDGSGKVVKINGAGSTFVFPIMSKWTALYDDVESKVRVNYQSIGSGGGIRQVIAGTVDFGATDGPMTDEQLDEAKKPIVHIPIVMGAVVPTYNLKVKKQLRFSGDVLADIFLGKIKKWNNPRLKKINPGVALPDKEIVIVHRADGSGTTYIWVDYLSKVSSRWRQKVGVSTSVNWPVGLGGKGNEGVAGQVKRIPGALGYVELTYALQNKMAFGKVRNFAGKFVGASPASVSEAGAGDVDALPSDLRVSITNAPGDKAYPISGFVWLIAFADQASEKDGKSLVNFVWWILGEGQKVAEPLDYAPLPNEVVELAKDKVKEIK